MSLEEKQDLFESFILSLTFSLISHFVHSSIQNTILFLHSFIHSSKSSLIFPLGFESRRCPSKLFFATPIVFCHFNFNTRQFYGTFGDDGKNDATIADEFLFGGLVLR